MVLACLLGLLIVVEAMMMMLGLAVIQCLHWWFNCWSDSIVEM